MTHAANVLPALRHVHDAGPTYNVTRNYVSHVRLALQSGSQSHARIDASVPLRNLPELLSTYWRADFDRNPTTTNANGDTVADWAVTGGGSFDTTKLINGIWTPPAPSKRGRSTTSSPRPRRSPLPQHERGRQRRRGPHQRRPSRRPIRAALGLRAAPIGRHANAHAQRQDIRCRDEAIIQPHQAAERLRPVSTHDPAAKQRREPADQRRRPGHVHVSNLRTDIDHRPIPHVVMPTPAPPNSITSMCAWEPTRNDECTTFVLNDEWTSDHQWQRHSASYIRHS